jgi:hypothetical protein
MRVRESHVHLGHPSIFALVVYNFNVTEVFDIALFDRFAVKYKPSVTVSVSNHNFGTNFDLTDFHFLFLVLCVVCLYYTISALVVKSLYR